ncbi:BrxE family protein [Desnuesiella massiliensis]|uniref:BrxE family protein n=1 Tax=Desnuesiella massiliensis TaxID=1650662 RepID=UPI0006E41BDF|nr:BrxE family protein [Desnuesiella massiliensis]
MPKIAGKVYNIEDIVRMRILILTLGGVEHASWWPGHFLTSTGLSFLSRIYPRSDFAAAVNSCNDIAREIHIDSVGNVAVFNILQLPIQYENEIEQFLIENNEILRNEYMKRFSDGSSLINELEKYIGNSKSAKANPGPIRVGFTKDTSFDEFFAKAIQCYYIGFKKGIKVFPYLEEAKKSAQ